MFQLKKGIIISAQVGFVDEFNHLVQWIRNLKATGGLTLTEKSSGHPILNVESLKLKSGSDSNVVLTKKSDGYTYVDVYYK